MKAKVLKSFPGCPDGQLRTRTLEAGETITGELAKSAVAAELASEVTGSADDAEPLEIPDDWEMSWNGLDKIAAARRLTQGFKGKAVDAEELIRAELARRAA